MTWVLATQRPAATKICSKDKWTWDYHWQLFERGFGRCLNKKKLEKSSSLLLIYSKGRENREELTNSATCWSLRPWTQMLWYTPWFVVFGALIGLCNQTEHTFEMGAPLKWVTRTRNVSLASDTTPARQRGFGLLDGRDQSVVVLCCCSDIREKLENRRTSCRGRSYYKVCVFRLSKRTLQVLVQLQTCCGTHLDLQSLGRISDRSLQIRQSIHLKWGLPWNESRGQEMWNASRFCVSVFRAYLW